MIISERLLPFLVAGLLVLALLSCAEEDAPKRTWPVPYGSSPETPAQKVLDSMATLDISMLEDSLIEIAPGRKQHFYTLAGRPYSGWVREDLSVSNRRIRYCQIDSGLVNWQIGYFTNGKRDCDFQMLHGFNHGSQRMWSEDGQPYIETYSIRDKPQGEHRRWHPNGVLDWFAEYDSGQLIRETHYNKEGKIEAFKGDFELPIPNEHEMELIKKLPRQGSGHTYQYLHHFFEPAPMLQPIKIEGYDTCWFTQSFADQIQLEIDQCRSIANNSKLQLPKHVGKDEVKRLMTILFPAEYGYSWSSDTLFYTEGGIPESADCQLVFPENDTARVVLIQCTE